MGERLESLAPPTCDRCAREWYYFIPVGDERWCPMCLDEVGEME